MRCQVPLDCNFIDVDQDSDPKLSKCELSVNQLTWLGYDINEDGYSPKFSKIDAIQALKPPRTSKQFRSFMGTLNHLQRLIPDLHTHTVHLRASLKACNKQSFLWGEERHNHSDCENSESLSL